MNCWLRFQLHDWQFKQFVPYVWTEVQCSECGRTRLWYMDDWATFEMLREIDRFLKRWPEGWSR